MKFIKHELGEMSGGEVAEVELTAAANVRLLDSSNFRKYRYGQWHRYYGGHYKISPVRLQIPKPGHWYVVVDLGGYGGRVGASIRVLPAPATDFAEEAPAVQPEAG